VNTIRKHRALVINQLVRLHYGTKLIACTQGRQTRPSTFTLNFELELNGL
jgi:hypothetical protein